MGFSRSTVGKESACNAGDPGLIPGLGRSPGEGKGNTLQYSCLENSMDRRAWRATVHGVSRVRHNWVTFTHSFQKEVSFNWTFNMQWRKDSTSLLCLLSVCSIDKLLSSCKTEISQWWEHHLPVLCQGSLHFHCTYPISISLFQQCPQDPRLWVQTLWVFAIYNTSSSKDWSLAMHVNVIAKLGDWEGR